MALSKSNTILFVIMINSQPRVLFDRMSQRKSNFFHTGATNLEYNYEVALDKFSMSSQSKNVLPFKREKIDYAKLHRVIDLKSLKVAKTGL